MMVWYPAGFMHELFTELLRVCSSKHPPVITVSVIKHVSMITFQVACYVPLATVTYDSAPTPAQFTISISTVIFSE